MGLLRKSVVSLRIMGDTLIPDDITNLMGCAPTVSYKKGDCETGEVTGAQVIRKGGMWLIEAAAATPDDINRQFEEILSQLPTDVQIWRELSQKFSIDFFCGVFMGDSIEGFSISQETLSSLGARGIELSFSIYDSSGD